MDVKGVTALRPEMIVMFLTCVLWVCTMLTSGSGVEGQGQPHSGIGSCLFINTPELHTEERQSAGSELLHTEHPH